MSDYDSGYEHEIEGELVELGAQEITQEIAVVEPTPPPSGMLAANLFGTDDPAAVIEKAARTASALADVITQRQLFKVINGKKYVYVEGWQLLGTILGVFPVMESCEPVELNGIKGYKAVVAAQTKDGAVVGRAQSLCMRNESKWANADEYAISSMAQTRAVSKCLRSPLGFIMQLAGFQATPEAEVPDGGFNDQPAARPAPKSPSPEQLERLAKGMEELTGKPGWSIEEVCQTATSTFKHPVAKLTDLTPEEADKILSAMKQFGGVTV